MMTWTKTKPALVLSAVVLGVLGTTFEVRKTSADEKADDSWRSAGLTWQQVGQTAPQVKILPTKFQPPVYHILTSDGIKRGGINVSVREIIWAAYRCSPGRMTFPAGEPQEKYDFISTLRQGTEEALQREVKNTLGLTGRWETLETNILALKVRNPEARGLKPAFYSPSEYGNLEEGHIHCFGEALSWKPPMPPWGLTKQLERIFQMPVVDETSLKGSYNLDLRWKVNTDPNANQEAVKQALIDQLGLELVPTRKARQAAEMLIVEKVQ